MRNAKRPTLHDGLLQRLSFPLCASAPLREHSLPDEFSRRGAKAQRGRISAAIVVALLVCSHATGCMGLLHRGMSGPPPRPLDNPLFLPPVDREFLWNQTVDAIDDYFRIEREERVRLIGGILTEGRIDTFPVTGSTILEPWRRDSTPGYEKTLATLQSIRRRATVRVIPAEGGYLLDVVVQKELEDLDKPQHATAGGATLRYDGTLVRQEGAAGRYSVTLGWIPIGRDFTLEQRILADIAARLDVQPAAMHGPHLAEEMHLGEEHAVGSPSDLHGPLLAPPQSSPFESLPPPQMAPGTEFLPPP